MPEKIAGLPWWFPEWIWRATHQLWFASIAMGFAGFYLISLINDVFGMIPLWWRVVTGVLSGLTFGLVFAMHRRWFERLIERKILESAGRPLDHD